MTRIQYTGEISMATGDLFVRFTAGHLFLTVTITRWGSVITPGEVPVSRQDIRMNGRRDASGYLADHFLIVDDRRP